MKIEKPRVSSYATPGEGNSTLISIVTIIALPNHPETIETRYIDGATMVVETATPTAPGGDVPARRAIYNKIR